MINVTVTACNLKSTSTSLFELGSVQYQHLLISHTTRTDSIQFTLFARIKEPGPVHQGYTYKPRGNRTILCGNINDQRFASYSLVSVLLPPRASISEKILLEHIFVNPEYPPDPVSRKMTSKLPTYLLRIFTSGSPHSHASYLRRRYRYCSDIFWSLELIIFLHRIL